MSSLNKNKLQELCQSNNWPLPEYSGIRQGPAHRPRFCASVLVHGFTFTTKTVLYSKKEAECSAAGLALSYFNQNPPPKSTIQPSPKPGLLYLTYKENESWVWLREKQDLQLKNLELENQIHLKKNELENCRKKLEYMNERAESEHKKAESLIVLAEKKKKENEKLHSEIIGLKDQLQAKQEVDEDFRAQKKIEVLEQKLEAREQELTDLSEFYDALTFKERSNNDELQGARKELIDRLEEANERAVESCSTWEEYVGDSTWNPFKVVRDEKGNRKETIDDEDEKLKILKTELGNEVYKVVTTSLMELNEHNSSGRYKIQELWNFKSGRKATLTEGVAYIMKQWNALKNTKKQRN